MPFSLHHGNLWKWLFSIITQINMTVFIGITWFFTYRCSYSAHTVKNIAYRGIYHFGDACQRPARLSFKECHKIGSWKQIVYINAYRGERSSEQHFLLTELTETAQKLYWRLYPVSKAKILFLNNWNMSVELESLLSQLWKLSYLKCDYKKAVPMDVNIKTPSTTMTFFNLKWQRGTHTKNYTFGIFPT